MRKLTLVIIAIACLDVAFVAYLSARRQNELATKELQTPTLRRFPGVIAPRMPEVDPVDDAVAAAMPAADEPAEKPQHSIDTDIGGGRPLRSALAGREYTASRRPISSRRIPAFPARNDVRDNAAASAMPGNITIFYPDPRKQVPEQKAGNPVRVEKTRPRSENRPLIAHLMPIVKKPYAWIKALGSKLN